MSLFMRIHAWVHARGDRGQATAEYALVLLGVAAVALLVGVWAAKTNLIGKLFDLVFRKIFDKA